MGRLNLALQVTKDETESKQKNLRAWGEGEAEEDWCKSAPSNLLPRRLLCEELHPAPAGSTLPTQGLRGDLL